MPSSNMSGIPADIWAAAQSVFSEGLWADEGDEREAVTIIARAILAEREACVKVVRDMAGKPSWVVAAALLSKSPRYFHDKEAIAEDSARPDWAYEAPTSPGNPDRNDGGGTQRKVDKQRGHSRRHAGFNDRWDSMSKEEQGSGKRNKRSVWTIATRPYPEAHFATMAPELAETCVKAGCPVGGTVLDPFGGAGTSGLVADRLGRNAILIELKP